MKELSLSLLSRGCGRLISSKGTTGRQDGRLDVCFTPQDYYIWKSQESLLRFSSSGHVLVKEESTLPKTYSTRRGPLLLYSQDLVTMETSCESEAENRKKRLARRYTEQVERQLSTLKELTAAILRYGKNQYTYSRLAPSRFPPLPFSRVPDLHLHLNPSPLPVTPTQAQPGPESSVQLNSHCRPAEENSEPLENLPEGREEEELDRKKRVRLDVFLQTACTSRSPTPQTEPQPWVHYVAVTPEEPEEVQAYLDMCLQHTARSQQVEINHQSTGGALKQPNMNCVLDVSDDRDCSVQRNSGLIGDEGNYERSTSGNRHGRTGEVKTNLQLQNINKNLHNETTSGQSLPPLQVGKSVCSGPCWEKTDWFQPRWEGQDCAGPRATSRLPPIAESRTVALARVIQDQTQQYVRPWLQRDGFQSQDNLSRLHHQPLVLPLLLPEKEEMSRKLRGVREKTERQNFKKQTIGHGGGAGGGRPSDKGSTILLEPGDEPPPVGVSGCVAGRNGPGKQSSLAFLQNRLLDPQDPCESSDANRRVVRGVLPLELRDLQNGRSVGSLILGPDGEIIQLSLYDSSRDPSQGDDVTQRQALQVLSTEGETLPWVIVLQPEHTYTDRGVELNTQHHQFVRERTESHMTVGQFAIGERSFSTEQLYSDVHDASSSHADTVAVTPKKTKRAEAVMETSEKLKKDGRNKVRMPPLRERVAKEEEARGGDTDAEEEEEEEEELAMTGQTGHSSGSHRPGLYRKKHQSKDDALGLQQKIGPTEATKEKAADTRRIRNMKRKDAEEAAVATGRSDMKTSESEGPTTPRANRDGGRQRQKVEGSSQPIRSQKPEERGDRGATETRDDSALPTEKTETREREGERGEGGEVKTSEDRQARGGGGGGAAKQKEASAGRRRRKKRGRVTHKELVSGNHEDPVEKDEQEINQEEEEVEVNSSRLHENDTSTKSRDDVEADRVSAADQRRSFRSVSSLWSSDAASRVSQRTSRRSTASSCEAPATPVSAMGLAAAPGCLSPCSTVMVTEEQLMLNPVKPESSTPRTSQEEAAALRVAQRAERRRQEVERKRREREEEEERKQKEREQTEERMKGELELERRKRAEELRSCTFPTRIRDS
ncbi:uncharacterized protein LOC118282571 isoform X2 [Scophthalmus maximus]|uniref:uncharacterized protein LOC118282571 isoform X2 n=1 Tax=Scophthalmus maximus TaxID=52904 RepID=UPI001FA87FEA|nr:uncharacterized protein LOC118282571 isoform X2 [Scophthalmus maximus]